jgi:hypothetical protein
MRGLVGGVVLLGLLVAQAANPTLTIDNNALILVSTTRVTRTVFDFTYQAQVTNTGITDMTGVVATLTSLSPTTVVIQGSLTFGDVPAGHTVTSTNTFTIRQDRTVPLRSQDLVWSITGTPTGPANHPPVANAGPAQTVFVGATVHLDGSKSSDVDGDPLTFLWALTAPPAGSLATLSDATAVQPAFAVDMPGTYTVQLIVYDGTSASAPALVQISTKNSPPVAKAGPDQTVAVGTLVHLDGSQSSDVDGDPLTFHWAITTAPSGSLATLSDPTAVQPTFVVDTPGTYTVQLLVNDGMVNSDPAIVVISTTNSRPVANTGPDQTVYVGTTVALDGRQSSDVDHDPLLYDWAITVRPAGSLATLSDPTISQPTVVVDRPGTYVVQLIVNDGTVDSLPATSTITAIADPQPPQLRLDPPEGAVRNTATLLLMMTYQDAESGVDLTSVQMSLDGVDVTTLLTVTATQATYQTTTLPDGLHILEARLRDRAGNATQGTAHFSIDTVPPAPIKPQALTSGPITNGQVTVSGTSGSVEPRALVKLTNTRTGQHVTVTATVVGSFTATLLAQSGDVVSITSTDAAGNISAPTQVTVGVPPDPATVAPPLDRSVATDLATASAFLYAGSTPIQTGVAPGTIAPRRVAVLRGRVYRPYWGTTSRGVHHGPRSPRIWADPEPCRWHV